MNLNVVILTMEIISTSLHKVLAEKSNRPSDIRKIELRHVIYNFKNTSAHKANLIEAPDQEWLDQSREDVLVAEDIKNRVSLLCWVMTFPDNHMKRAIHVKETWGSRCDVLLFMSSKEDTRLPTVKLEVEEGRENLWIKTKAAFRYIYDRYLYAADWFLKADDDTYVVVENLKYFLDEYNTNDAIHFGSRFKSEETKDGYFSGGAGYVLSREALTRFVTKGPKTCTRLQISLQPLSEDLEMTRCLDLLGVFPMDSRDDYQRGRFFPFSPYHHVHVKEDQHLWYWRTIYYPIKNGRDCCSEFAISFHYVEGNMMYILEYFVYHLKLYGVSYQYEIFN